MTVSHTAETFTTSGTSTVTGDATTSITAQSSDVGSYTVTYTMADKSNSNVLKTTTVNLKVIDPCLPTWNLPTPASYTNSEYVIDIATQPDLTITWTGDTNQRECDYVSTISFTDDTGTAYNSLSYSHTSE